MDCQTFDSSLLDALYGELDEASSASMDEHAAGCASCAGRLAKLKRTRNLIRPALAATLPATLEERVMAAATAAMDSPRSNVVSLADRKKEPKESDAPSGGGTILRFLAKPQLAIAATFLLVLGAAVVFNSSKREAAPTAAMEADPAAAAAREVPPPPPAATFAAEEAPPAAAASMVALAAPAATAAALHDDLDAPSGGAKGRAAPKAKAHDPAFATAKSLYDAGRYAEALAKFEALAPHDAEAELYVARCLARTKSCDAAAPRYDSAARRNAGTESASRAALEAARCYKDEGKLAAARSRYVHLENDSFVSREASAELATLDTAPRAAETKASKPAATATAPTPARPAKPANAQGF